MESWGVWFWTSVSVLSYLLTLVLIRWVLLRRSRVPAATVAWIMLIVLIPVVGGILYLVFGINRVGRRKARRQAAMHQIAQQRLKLLPNELLPADLKDDRQRQMVRLTSRVGEMGITAGNSVELLHDTNRTLGLIRQAIQSARETLHLEYYIWQPDKTGTQLRDLLIEKAREGVKVRFLFDGIGSLWLGRKFLKPMLEAGIQVAAFLPGMTLRERWSINLRNHRKIVIVDGLVAFTGGMNIGDEYHGKDKTLGYWRDTHLRMTGPAVLQLQQIFLEDWYYATQEKLAMEGLFPTPVVPGNVMAQVISGEPAGDLNAFLAVFFSAINEARLRVTLATSYFVPPEPLVTALESAALRGVRVRLLVAGRATHHWTVLAGRSYYDSLLRAGCEIYEFRQAMLHSKTLTIDGEWSMVGSPNFDNRSLALNFEAAVALYDDRLAFELEQQFEQDLKFATKIDRALWDERSTWEQLKENASRLFAPVL